MDDNKPIYIQVREIIEDQIVNDQIQAGDQIPSTTQFVNFYKINHVIVLKGFNQLVDEAILYKKRGIGIFVMEGAKEKLIKKRTAAFQEDYLTPLIQEAEKLGITKEDIIALLQKRRELT